MPISTTEDGYLYETSLIASYAPDEDLRLNIKKYNKKKNQTTWLNKLLKAKHIPNSVYNQITSKLPSWQINLSYDGKYIALAKDCYIEIKCKERSWRDDDIKMFVGEEEHLQFRKIAWSSDSSMIALSSSVGKIHIFRIDGTCLSIIHSPPSTNGLLDPFSGLFFIESKKHRKGVPKTAQNYTHELICISYSGLLTSYLIDYDFFPLDGYFDVIELTEITTTITEDMPPVVYNHSYYFFGGDLLVTSVSLDLEECSFTIAHSPLNKKDGSASCFTEWVMTSDSSFYKMKSSDSSLVNSSPSANAISKDVDGKNVIFKQMIANLFNVDKLLSCPMYVELSPKQKNYLLLYLNGELEVIERSTNNILYHWNKNDLNNKRIFLKEKKALLELFAAKWWNDETLILNYSDGATILVKIPDLVNTFAEGSEEMCFGSPVCFDYKDNENIFLVEMNCEDIKLTLQNGEYLPFCSLNSRQKSPTSSTTAISNSQYQWIYTSFMNLASTTTIPLRFFVNAFLWHWEDDSEKLIQLKKRTFSFYIISQSTPKDFFIHKIQQKDYTTAHQLVNKFPDLLSIEDVYKAQWLDSFIDQTSIDNLVSNIKDKIWVLQNCVERIPSTSSETRVLYEYGLKQTDDINKNIVLTHFDSILNQIEGGITKSTPELPIFSYCKFRLLLLQYTDRLQTHIEIFGLSKTFPNLSHSVIEPSTLDFARHFAEFRKMDLVKIAISFAIRNNVNGLKRLFTRHSHAVLPYRFAILEHFNEFTHPNVYKIFIPAVDLETQREIEWSSCIPWRKKDWVEENEIVEFVQMMDDGETDSSEPLDKKLVKIVYPCKSLDKISSWVDSRARFIEDTGCHVENALALVNICKNEKSIQGLDKLIMNLKILQHFVYDRKYTNISIELDLKRVQGMQVKEIVDFFLDHAIFQDTETLQVELREFLVPYLKYLVTEKNMRSEDVIHIFYEYLKELSVSHLNFTSLILGQEERDAFLFPDSVEFAKLVLDCAYSSRICDSYIESLLRLINRFSEPDSSPASDHGREGWDADLNFDCLDAENTNIVISTDPELSQRIGEIKIHVQAAAVLFTYNMGKPLTWFSKSNLTKKEQRACLLSLVRQKNASESTWERLQHHLLLLQNLGIFKDLPSEDIYAEFLSSALNEGAFDFVKHTFDCSTVSKVNDLPLPVSLFEKLVVDSARELFDNAITGDMNNDSNIKMALECLKILPLSKICAAEIDFIESVHQLYQLKTPISLPKTPEMPIMPIQIRLYVDRVELIKRALELNSHLYSSVGLLLDISKKLIGQEKSPAQMARVKAIIADAALDHDDVTCAWKLCESLIKQEICGDAGVTWKVCKKLALHEAFIDSSKKLQLIQFVLTICPAEEMDNTLSIWEHLSSENLVVRTVESQISASNAGPSSSSLGLFNNLPLSKEFFFGGTSPKIPSKKVSSTPPTIAKKNIYPDNKFSIDSTIKEFSRYVETLSGNKNQASSLTNNYEYRLFYQKNLTTHKHQRNDPLMDDVTRKVLECLISMHVHKTSTEMKNAGSIPVSDLIIKMATCCIDNDTSVGLGYLMNLADDRARMFFDSLAPSAKNEQLASYFFSLRALYRIISIDGYMNVPQLENFPPKEIISFVNTISSQTFASRNIAQPDLEKLEGVISCVNYYTSLSVDKKQERLLRTIHTSDNVDLQRFNDDEAYKRDVLIGLMHILDNDKIESTLSAIEQLGFMKSEMVLEHFVWLFDFYLEDTRIIQEQLDKYGDFLLENTSHSSGTLCKLHSKVKTSPLGTLSAYYQLLFDIYVLIEGSSSITKQLDFRLVFIKLMKHHPLISSLTFQELFVCRSANDVTKFLKSFVGETVESILSLSPILSALLKLKPISIFLDENDLIEGVTSNDFKNIFRTLCVYFFDTQIFKDNWECDQLEIISSSLSATFLSHLLDEDIVSISSKLSVSQNACYIPIKTRIAFLSAVAAAIAKDSEVAQKVERFTDHLNFLNKLSEVVDASTGEIIPIEWVQQIDLCYSNGTKPVAAILMKMVISGTSPFIINECCIICTGYFKNGDGDENTIFDLNAIFKATVFSVIDTPIDASYAKVFRKGIESPMSALKRIVTSVLEYEVIDISLDGLNDGWGETLDIEIPSDDDGFTKTLKQLQDVVRDTLKKFVDDATHDPAFRLDIVELLKEHFDIVQTEHDNFKKFEAVSKINAIWDTEIDQTLVTDNGKRIDLFQNLLGKSVKEDQFRALVELLLRWEAENVLKLVISEEDLMDDPWGSAEGLADELKDSGGDNNNISYSACWNQLIDAIVKNQLPDCLYFLVLEGLNAHVITPEVENNIIEILNEQDLRYLKIYFLFNKEELKQKALADINDVFKSVSTSRISLQPPSLPSHSVSPPLHPNAIILEKDRCLHLILASKGLLHLFTKKELWPSICHTLLNYPVGLNLGNVSETKSYDSVLMKSIFDLSKLDVHNACELYFDYMQTPMILRKNDLSYRKSVLKNFFDKDFPTVLECEKFIGKVESKHTPFSIEIKTITYLISGKCDVIFNLDVSKKILGSSRMR